MVHGPVLGPEKQTATQKCPSMWQTFLQYVQLSGYIIKGTGDKMRPWHEPVCRVAGLNSRPFKPHKLNGEKNKNRIFLIKYII